MKEEPGPDLWLDLGERLDNGTIALWCPEPERYQWRPAASLIASVAALSTSTPTSTRSPHTDLNLRTRDTATEIRLRIRSGELPPHVTGGTREYPVPLLAISELVGSGDPGLQAAFEHILR